MCVHINPALCGPALCVFALCGQIFIGQSPHFAGVNPALCGINPTFCCVSKPIILKIHIFAPFLSDFKVHFFKNLWQYKQQVFCVLISWKYTQIFFDFYSKCHDFDKNFLPPITTSHFAFIRTLLDFSNQSPQLLSIYNPALCVFALCAISLPPIYRKVRGLCVLWNLIKVINWLVGKIAWMSAWLGKNCGFFY